MMFNASLEKYKTQCDSKVFVFKPNSQTPVPTDLEGFVYEQMKWKGIFIVPPRAMDVYNNIDKKHPEFKAAKREALLLYLGITLRERIVNYLAYEDDQRKRGATIMPDPRFERAKRWEKELRKMLEMEAPIEEELSFLEEVRLENTKGNEETEASFIEEESEPVAAPKKRGRKPKVQPEVLV